MSADRPERDASSDPGPDPRSDVDAGGEPVDVLPADLDVTAYVGPHLFPDIRRRRLAGAILATLGACSLVGAGVSGDRGLLFAGVLLVAIAAYHVAASWPMRIDQIEALAAASRAVGFPVGHASAQLAWRGLRSRPSWRILLYSADAPPSLRGLVELDAVDAEVIGEYDEPNPEDWSAYGLDE
jgi:hypothetical protein